jgi:hypothetical protein
MHLINFSMSFRQFNRPNRTKGNSGRKTHIQNDISQNEKDIGLLEIMLLKRLRWCMIVRVVMHFWWLECPTPLIKVEIEPLENTFQKFKNWKNSKKSIHKFKIPKWLILDTVNMHSENEMIYKCKFWETLKPDSVPDRSLRIGLYGQLFRARVLGKII